MVSVSAHLSAVLGTEEALGVGWGADTALEVVGGDVELWRGTSVSAWPRGTIQRFITLLQIRGV